MTKRPENPILRRVICSGCGTEFICSPTGACWCAEETVRLPMPVAGEDCLCRNCLRGAGAKGVASETKTPGHRQS